MKEFFQQNSSEQGGEIDVIKNNAAELMPEMYEHYKEIHENPEVGGQEYETARRVKEYLEKLGVEIIGEKIGGTGIVAKINGSTNGPTIALRADMDALMQNENENNNPRSQKPGIMHACGHDAHTVALMGAAKILKNLAQQGGLNGNAVLLFQPNEDKAVKNKTGAVEMVKFLEKSGLRKDIKAFFGLHALTMLERGQVLLSDDQQMAGSGFFDLQLKTKGGHGTDIKVLPDIDYILSDIKIKVSEAFEEYWRNNEALVESMGPKIKNEVADNVIMSEGGRRWVLRITSPQSKEISKDVYRQIKEIVFASVQKNIDSARERAKNSKGINIDEKNMQVEISIDIKPNYRPVIHRNSDLVGIADKSAKQTIENYIRINKGVLAGEDFSFYLEKFRGLEIPGVYMLVGAANSKKGISKKSHHSSDFQIDPEVMKDLAALHSAFCVNAINFFNSKQKEN